MSKPSRRAPPYALLRPWRVRPASGSHWNALLRGPSSVTSCLNLKYTNKYLGVSMCGLKAARHCRMADLRVRISALEVELLALRAQLQPLPPPPQWSPRPPPPPAAPLPPLGTAPVRWHIALPTAAGMLLLGLCALVVWWRCLRVGRGTRGGIAPRGAPQRDVLPRWAGRALKPLRFSRRLVLRARLAEPTCSPSATGADTHSCGDGGPKESAPAEHVGWGQGAAHGRELLLEQLRFAGRRARGSGAAAVESEASGLRFERFGPRGLPSGARAVASSDACDWPNHSRALRPPRDART